MLAAALLGSAGCIQDRSTGPAIPAAARLAISAEVSARAATDIRVLVGYARRPDAGSPSLGVLLDTRIPLTPDRRAIPISFDVAPCLTDRGRAETGPFCAVSVKLELLDASASILDSGSVRVEARPGQTDTIPEPVRLFEVARIEISAPAATVQVGGTVQLSANARDLSDRPLPGRAVQWTSSDPNVASVDAATGLVTALAEGTVNISAATGGKGANVTITVVRRPAIALQPRTLTFSGVTGTRPAAQRVTVSNGGAGSLENLSLAGVSFAANQPANWLEVSALDRTTAPASFTVQPVASVVQSPLPVGTYTAWVRIASPVAANSPDSVQVTYRVTARPAIVFSVPSVTVPVSGGEALPGAQTVTVSNAGDGALDGLTQRVEFLSGPAEGWLTAQLGRTSTDAPLNLSIVRSDLVPGSYSARVTVSTTTPGVTAASLTVTINVTVRFVTVTAGGRHSCGLTASGSAYCWGSNNFGQIGIGTADTGRRTVPTPVIGGNRFIALSAGGDAVCGITQADAVQCWGRTPGTAPQPTLVPQAQGGGYTAIAVGDAHACVLGRATPNRTNAFCWGDFVFSQLGDGTASGGCEINCVRSTPAPVADTATFTSISAGTHHTCALGRDGFPRCWGRGFEGQLGIGPAQVVNRPLRVDSIINVTTRAVAQFSAVAAGGHSSCGIVSSSSNASSVSRLFCWGQHARSFTNNPPLEGPVVRPTLVGGVATATSVAVGAQHFCSLGGNPVACWGLNNRGEVGNGSTAVTFTPAPLSPSGFTQISAGGDASDSDFIAAHTCGIAAGVAHCWGLNTDGQVGDGTVSTNRTRPTRVAGQP